MTYVLIQSREASQMIRLEEITSGIKIKDFFPNKTVTIVHVIPHGADSLAVYYEDKNGNPQKEALFRTHKANLKIVTDQEQWQFDGNGRFLSGIFNQNQFS